MKSLLVRIVFILAFCVATVGAAGFAEEIEPEAMPLYGGGLAVVAVAGFVMRRELHRRAHEDPEAGGLTLEGLIAAVEEVRKDVAQLKLDAPMLDDHALRQRIDEILLGDFFEIGNRNEAYIRALGNADYTRVWDGFATAERLLARAWSMAADGHLEEAVEELPRALRHLDRAVAAEGA